MPGRRPCRQSGPAGGTQLASGHTSSIPRPALPRPVDAEVSLTLALLDAQPVPPAAGVGQPHPQPDPPSRPAVPRCAAGRDDDTALPGGVLGNVLLATARPDRFRRRSVMSAA